MGPSYMNQKAIHIERKQQTAEYDRFKKALTKIVLQKRMASSTLGIVNPNFHASKKGIFYHQDLI